MAEPVGTVHFSLPGAPAAHSAMSAAETARAGVGSGAPLVDFGITPASSARLRGAGGQFIKWDAENLALAIRLTHDVGMKFEQAVKNRFLAGGHNQTGYTLSTIHFHQYGLHGVLISGGGMEFLETGTVEHDILPSNATVLMFQAADGDVIWRPSVYHPGIAKDPIIEDAERQVDLIGSFQKFTSQAWMDYRIAPSNSVP